MNMSEQALPEQVSVSRKTKIKEILKNETLLSSSGCYQSNRRNDNT